MDFVWIYAFGPSFYAKRGTFNELEYSIKSVRKFFTGEPRCWVVGDDPKLDVDHIYHKQLFTHVSGRPGEIDQVQKFYKILDSEIGDEFILMMDDVFYLQPFDETDLRVTWAYDVFENYMTYRRKWGGSYKFAWQDTYKIIDEQIRPGNRYDWETHLPRYIEKHKLAQVLTDKFTLGGKQMTPSDWGVITTSLYHAHFAEQTIIMPDDLQYDLNSWPPYKSLDEGFKMRYLNLGDHAIVPDFVIKMEEVFGESVSVKSAHRRY